MDTRVTLLSSVIKGVTPAMVADALIDLPEIDENDITLDNIKYALSKHVAVTKEFPEHLLLELHTYLTIQIAAHRLYDDKDRHSPDDWAARKPRELGWEI